MYGFVIFLLLAIAIFAYSIYKSVTSIKSVIKVDYIKLKWHYLISLIASSICFGVMSIFIPELADASFEVGQKILLFVSGTLIFAAFFTFFNSFIIHYYSKELDEKVNKLTYILTLVSGVAFILLMWFYTDRFADILTYPLVNGINFENGLSTPKSWFKPNLAWYAVCILTGALLVYFFCDHKFYLRYGRHGAIESTFLVAFPSGILGARLFYVIGNWHEFAGGDFLKVFAIWEGGLTILGGAVCGAVVGILWFIKHNKDISIWDAVDIIIPCILFAQAIGRWGNFFNCEVHGELVSASDWGWLPKVVLNNSRFSSTCSTAPDGMIYLPLFFIESRLNWLGFFIIYHLFGIALKKWTCKGDLAISYLVWYGLVRALLEPLRNASYNMGEDGYWSYLWSLVFIFVGVLLISLNHLIRRINDKKNNMYDLSSTSFNKELIKNIVLLIIVIGLVVAGCLLFSSDVFDLNSLEFNGCTIGLVLLTLGVSMLLLYINFVPRLIDTLALKKEGK